MMSSDSVPSSAGTDEPSGEDYSEASASPSVSAHQHGCIHGENPHAGNCSCRCGAMLASTEWTSEMSSTMWIDSPGVSGREGAKPFDLDEFDADDLLVAANCIERYVQLDKTMHPEDMDSYHQLASRLRDDAAALPSLLDAQADFDRRIHELEVEQVGFDDIWSRKLDEAEARLSAALSRCDAAEKELSEVRSRYDQLEIQAKQELYDLRASSARAVKAVEGLQQEYASWDNDHDYPLVPLKAVLAALREGEENG